MKRVALAEVATIDRSTASDEECRTLPYVGLDDIEKDRGAFADGFEGQPEQLLATKFRFTPRHVLYGKLRPYLNKVALPTFDGVCTTEILPILPSEGKLDRTYLWAFMLAPSFVKWASRNVSGANLPRISPKLLAQYRIPLPPLPEQQRIASTLAKADRLRRLRRYALELSDTYLQSVFLEMFGDPVTNPMGWETATLQGLVAEGRIITYGIVQAGPHIEEGIPYIRSGDIKDGRVMIDDLLRTSRDIAASYKRSEVLEGDLVFSIRASVGAVAEVPAELTGANLTQGTARIAPGPRLLRKYLLYALRTDGFQAWIAHNTKGATFKEITLAKLREAPMSVPPLELQHQFAHIARRFERLRAQQREALRQAEHLFQTLLHQAFQGEV